MIAIAIVAVLLAAIPILLIAQVSRSTSVRIEGWSLWIEFSLMPIGAGPGGSGPVGLTGDCSVQAPLVTVGIFIGAVSISVATAAYVIARSGKPPKGRERPDTGRQDETRDDRQARPSQRGEWRQRRLKWVGKPSTDIDTITRRSGSWAASKRPISGPESPALSWRTLRLRAIGACGRQRAKPGGTDGGRRGGTSRLWTVRWCPSRGRRGDGHGRVSQTQGPMSEETTKNTVATKNAAPGAVSKPKLPARGHEILVLLERARAGSAPSKPSTLADGLFFGLDHPHART